VGGAAGFGAAAGLGSFNSCHGVGISDATVGFMTMNLI
jgi:hypothetical protein